MSVGMRPLVGGSHLLNALGINSNEVFQQLDQIQQRVGLLKQLSDGFQGAGGGLQPNALAGLLQQGNIPTQGAMPPPNMGACGCGGAAGFAKQVDLGASRPGANPMEAMMNRQQGAMMERFLTSNPFGRQQLEMQLGGRVLPDGVADGRLQIQPFPQGNFPGGGVSNFAANNAMGALNGLNQAALASPFGGLGGGFGKGGDVFNNAILGGLANVLGKGGGNFAGLGGGGFTDMMSMQGLNPAGIIAGQGVAPQAMGTLPGIDNPILKQAVNLAGMNGMGALGGMGNMAGNGTYMPGDAATALNTVGAGLGGGGLGGAGGAGGAGGPAGLGAGLGAGAAGGLGAGLGDNIMGMNDAGLTVEDKVTLLLMQIMKKLDKEIEQQGNNLQKLQAQGGAQGAGGAPGGQTPSIDVESMKLKRLIDKRNQMFDTLRQIVDKYNQTAKGMIDTVGR